MWLIFCDVNVGTHFFPEISFEDMFWGTVKQQNSKTAKQLTLTLILTLVLNPQP